MPTRTVHITNEQAELFDNGVGIYVRKPRSFQVKTKHPFGSNEWHGVDSPIEAATPFDAAIQRFAWLSRYSDANHIVLIRVTDKRTGDSSEFIARMDDDGNNRQVRPL